MEWEEAWRARDAALQLRLNVPAAVSPPMMSSDVTVMTDDAWTAFFRRLEEPPTEQVLACEELGADVPSDAEEDVEPEEEEEPTLNATQDWERYDWSRVTYLHRFGYYRRSTYFRKVLEQFAPTLSDQETEDAVSFFEHVVEPIFLDWRETQDRRSMIPYKVVVRWILRSLDASTTHVPVLRNSKRQDEWMQWMDAHLPSY